MKTDSNGKCALASTGVNQKAIVLENLADATKTFDVAAGNLQACAGRGEGELVLALGLQAGAGAGDGEALLGVERDLVGLCL